MKAQLPNFLDVFQASPNQLTYAVDSTTSQKFPRGKYIHIYIYYIVI